MANMTEDDIYRASTQYRLWSFTPESLASLRSATNSLAADGVRTAIHSLNLSRAETEAENVNSHDQDPQLQLNISREVDCLTVEEEQKLVGFYCIRTMEFADFCDFPTNVKATAVQYLKRFYLSNSPMTYHPKEMMPSALFLATKTENHYTSLKSFVSKLPKTTAEDVVAPEFLLTQGLRFTFDVRHPQRGLEGGFMELLALANGNGHAGASADSSRQLQQDMLGIEPLKAGKAKAKTAAELVLRIQNAHGKAKETLKTSALLTDAYFLYTPSQIWLSALLSADSPLARFYLSTKLAAGSTSLRTKIHSTLQHCSTLLQRSASAAPGEVEMKELTRIDKKLYQCRNPAKIDLVGINKAQKRDGGGEEGEESVRKRRRMEREDEMREGERVFGPSL